MASGMGIHIVPVRDSDLIINSKDKITDFEMEYARQQASGNCTVSIGRSAIPIKMYSSSWISNTITVKFLNRVQIIFAGTEIFLIILLVLYAVKRCLFYHKNRKQEISSVKSTLTMFDTTKGLAMIAIILLHSLQDVTTLSELASGINSLILKVILVSLLYCGIPLFAVVSGYGFRKGPIGRTSYNQIKYFLIPYAKLIIIFIIFGLIKAGETNSYTIRLFKRDLISLLTFDTNMGPVWYIFVLVWAWIILNILLSTGKKWIEYVGIISSVILSCILGKYDIHYFCLIQIFAVLPIIYIGYLIKKNKIWIRETGISRIMYILLAIVFLISVVMNGLPFSMAENKWGQNQIAGIIISALGGVLLTRFILGFNKKLKGKLLLVKTIGRESFLICFIHTFEYLTIPWDKLFMAISIPSYFKVMIIFALRSLLIFAIYISVKKLKIIGRRTNCKNI